MTRNIFFISILLVSLSNSLHSKTPSSSICEDKFTCDTCMGTLGCSWCKIKSNNTFQRCNTEDGHLNNPEIRCPKPDIVTAGQPKQHINKSVPMSKTMRIAPQQVYVHLPVGKEIEISLAYKDDADKALDLYYIMDLSATMENDKDTVSAQAKTLVHELKKITKDVQLGFGSFIDKPVLPFVSSSQLRPDSEKKYEIPYGFRNGQALSPNVENFARVVKGAKISRNLDSPEGTLDALMQAILCKDEIGWRNHSRKLIVVATDGPFHIAGDGKLGGIVRPNDMKCHMSKGEYTHSKLIDYPSIGEMNAVILQQKVFVIFAISQEGAGDQVFQVYHELEKHVSQSAAVRLKEDSSDVIQKIKAKYLEISQKVQLQVDDEATKSFVEVKVYAKCSPSDGYVQRDYCNNVEVQSKIDFKINLKLKECPKSQLPRLKNNNKIVISFIELTNKEKLVIDLSYACSCDCNNDISTNGADLTRYCNGLSVSDSISCGICNCKEGRSGQACQCSSLETGENVQGNVDKCINKAANNAEIICSSRGKCKCGQCECDKGRNGVPEFNGKYCQDSTSNCQNKDSQYSDYRLCSGPENGRCEKGTCICKSGYDGKFCECEVSKKKLCIEPGQSLTSPKYCNGHGTCACSGQQAECACHPGYKGIYCGICKINCPTSGEKLGSRCQDEFITSCVRCKIKSKLNSDKLQCTNECDWNKRKTRSKTGIRSESNVEFDQKYRSAAGLSGTVDGDEEDGTECKIKFNDTCSSVFKYKYERSGESDKLIVYYTTEGMTCSKEPPIIWYAFATILGVLLLGIFGLLIWKLATYLHDTREYKRFEKERAGASWGGGQNPLYEDPIQETQNPAYQR